MLLRDKSLERQDDVLKAIKNIPEDILVKLGVLDILMNGKSIHWLSMILSY